MSNLFEEEYRWPKKGDNPFLKVVADPMSPTWASLKWLRTFNVDDSFLADAFKKSGDVLIKELAEGKIPRHADIYFFPIAFNYRHSLELKMKEIIKLGIRLGLIEEDKKLLAALKDHNLYRLWNYVKSAIILHWPDGPKEDISAAENIIQAFHDIDRSGQALRYTEDTKGRKTLEQLPEAVQLTHLKDVCDAIFNFLSGCETGLYEDLQIRNEMLSEYM